MPFIPATNTCKTTVHWQLGGQELRSILHFHKATPWTLADQTAFLTAMDGDIAANWLTHLHHNLTYNEIDIVDLSSANLPVSTITRSTALTGGHTSGACFTGQDSVVLTKRTAKSGRSFRGRLYVPGIPVEVQGGNNTVTTAFLGQLLTDFASLIVDGIVSGIFHVVLSQFSGVDSLHKPIARSSALPTNVTALTADVSIDSQNRRLEGRGN